MNQLAIVCSSSPFADMRAQEGLDVALTAGTFGLVTALFFADDGVFQLIKHQQPDKVHRKAFYKTFAALEFYDVEPIYVLSDSLAERELSAADLVLPVTEVTLEQWQQYLAGYQHIVSF